VITYGSQTRHSGESLMPRIHAEASLAQGPGRKPGASSCTPKRLSARSHIACNMTQETGFEMRVDDMASIICQALPQSALQPKRPKAGVSYGG